MSIKGKLLCLLILLFAFPAHALRVGILAQEADGIPSAYIYKLIVPNDSLSITNNIGTYVDAGSVGKEDLLVNEAGLYAALSDVADFMQPSVAETITGNWVNIAHPWVDNEVADALTVTAQAGSTWDIADSVTIGSVYSGTTSLEETTAADDSGAYLIGVYDEFDNSDSANVQDVLDDLDALIGVRGNIYSDNTNGNPNVSDTEGTLNGYVAENTWESVGPTDSGADNIWTAMDTIPADADWIELKAYAYGTQTGGTPGTSVLAKISVRENSGTQASGGDNHALYYTQYIDGDGNASFALVNSGVKVEMDGDLIFDILWMTSYGTTEGASVFVTGYGYNPSGGGGGGGGGTDDQAASEVEFTPAGNIEAVEVQAALEEVDTEKQVDLDVVSQADAEAGSATDERIWTAQRVKQAIDKHAPGGLDEVVYLSDCSGITNGFCIDKDDDYLYYSDETENVVQLYPTSGPNEEAVEDYVGGMVTGNTETRIAVTYVDGGVGAGILNFVVDDMNDDEPDAGDFGNATDLDLNGKILATAISGLSNVTSTDSDYVIIWDATDSALKKCDMGEIRGGGASMTTESSFVLRTHTGDGTTTINWQTGNKHKFTFGAANETMTFTAPAASCNLLLTIKQDATGSRTITWPNTVKWSGGNAPILSTGANEVDIVSFFYDGTSYYGACSLNFS